MDKVKIATCEVCGQPVLAGRIQGLATRLDPYAVTPRGETQAGYSLRPTYTITANGSACRPRTQDDNRAQNRGTVLVSHIHGNPPTDIDTEATIQLLKGFLPSTVDVTGNPPY